MVTTGSRGRAHSADDGQGEQDGEDGTLLLSLQLAWPLDVSLQLSSKDVSAWGVGTLELGELLKEAGVPGEGVLEMGEAFKEGG